MFEVIARTMNDRNGDNTVTVKWHGTNQYQTILADDLRQLQADYNEFVPEVEVPEVEVCNRHCWEDIPVAECPGCGQEDHDAEMADRRRKNF